MVLNFVCPLTPKVRSHTLTGCESPARRSWCPLWCIDTDDFHHLSWSPPPAKSWDRNPFRLNQSLAFPKWKYMGKWVPVSITSAMLAEGCWLLWEYKHLLSRTVQPLSLHTLNFFFIPQKITNFQQHSQLSPTVSYSIRHSFCIKLLDATTRACASPAAFMAGICHP